MVAPARRADLAARLAGLYRSDPDPGTHSAAEWALRRWGLAGRVDEAALAGAPRGDGAVGWRVMPQVGTLIELRRPAEFVMGSPTTEAGRRADEQPVPRRPRPFAIAAKKTTTRSKATTTSATKTAKAAPKAAEKAAEKVGD